MFLLYAFIVKIPAEEKRKEQARILAAFFEVCPFNSSRFLWYMFLETMNLVNVSLQVSFLQTL